MDWYTETEISSGWSEKGGPGITIIFGNYSSDKESLKLDQRDVIIIGVGETLINEYEKIRIGRHRGFVFG